MATVKHALNTFKGKFRESTLRFEEIKKNVEVIIKCNTYLAEYYKGFVCEFGTSFTAAQSIASGVITFKKEKNLIISLVTKSASLIPFVGEYISSGTNYVKQYISSTCLKTQSNNLIKFGVSTTNFDKIAEYVAGSTILDSTAQKAISDYKGEEAKEWLNKVNKLMEKARKLKDI
ncbi:MAG: hypothetical protein RCG15_06130 [Candidatus Rickettsia vulgarisii]